MQVNPAMIEQLESGGMMFVGHGDDGKRMEIMELQGVCVLRLHFAFVFSWLLLGFHLSKVCLLKTKLL